MRRFRKRTHFRFYDHTKTRRKLPLFDDLDASKEAARSIQRLVNFRASNLDLLPELQRFILHTLPSIKERLAEWSIIYASYLASVKGLDEYITKWKDHLETKNSTERYIDQRVRRVRHLFEHCGFKRWTEIKATIVASMLSKWRKCEGMKFGAQTSNFYLQSAKGFCKYMRDVEKCVTDSPLSELSYEDVKEDRRHDHRAFDIEEFKYLLGHLAVANTIWHISPAERALIYQFAAETGLRISSIRRIEVRSFGVS